MLRRALILLAACSTADIVIEPPTDPFPEPCDFGIRCGLVERENIEACVACVECFLAINPKLRNYSMPEISCEAAERWGHETKLTECAALGTRKAVKERTAECGSVIQ